MKHGRWNRKLKDKTYQAWMSMNQRCNTPTCKDYSHWGGRGITICERWREFSNFLADMGDAPPGMSLDRIDNHGNYGPTNCRWATPFEQSQNTRTVRLVEFNGETMSMRAWSKKLGIDATTIRGRVIRGVPIDGTAAAQKPTE